MREFGKPVKWSELNESVVWPDFGLHSGAIPATMDQYGRDTPGAASSEERAATLVGILPVTISNGRSSRTPAANTRSAGFTVGLPSRV